MVTHPPLVSVIIPTYNRKEMLGRLVDTIFKSDYPRDKLEIIVVDDASSDGTYEYVRRQFPAVRIIRNSSEKWVSASRNIGIREATGDFLFLVDDDNVLDRHTISELVNAIRKDEKVGIAAPIMYYYQEPNKIWCAGIRRNRITSRTRYLYKDQLSNALLPEILDSEDFPNAFIVKRKLIEEIGLLDETDFSIHYDEADFCKRARLAGWKVLTVTRAKIWHDIPSPSQSKNFDRTFFSQKEERVYFAARNRIIFHRKHTKPREYIIFSALFLPLFTTYYLLRIIRSKSGRRTRLMGAYMRGVLDGLAMKQVK